MAMKEIKTDLWVYKLLEDAHINLDAQGSNIKEINDALKTGTKKGTGKNPGYPEYCGVVGDFVIVIEDKADTAKHIKYDKDGTLSSDTTAVIEYAVNGAIHYAKHIARLTAYKKIIAIGVSGNEKRHRISPVYVDETEFYRELPEVEGFISFSEDNIDEYYIHEILQEDTDREKETAEILKDAAQLHEYLRNYGNVKDEEKPIIVSGILLALREGNYHGFKIADLTGDKVTTDGEKIYNAIDANLKRSSVSPEVKKDKILHQFNIIKESPKLNEVNNKLGKTPLKYFTEFLDEKLYRSFKFTKSSEDILGRFYGEFMSYSGGSGQSLGIILTPKHITDLFCELVNLQETDYVLDPCCGTGGFLVSAMHHMLEKTNDETAKRNIQRKQLHGIELRPDMFTIATTNMILRGDGKSNLINDDFIMQNPAKLQLKQCNIGFMNPPYSQGSKSDPEWFEIACTEHLLDSIVEGGKVVVIVQQSSVTGKSKEEKAIRRNILKHHTLEGVITLNTDTFYGVGVNPVIAVFTAGIPHPTNKVCKFIDFKDDGYKVAAHIGLIETESAKDKRQHLLDVWNDRTDADTKFCVKTTIEEDDEWLHSFYYFNDVPPTDDDFVNTMADYLTFQFNMITHGRGYIFEEAND